MLDFKGKAKWDAWNELKGNCSDTLPSFGNPSNEILLRSVSGEERDRMDEAHAGNQFDLDQNGKK